MSATNICSCFRDSEDLNPNPTTELEKIVNDLRIKYRTYVVDLDVEYVSIEVFAYTLLTYPRNILIQLLIFYVLICREWLFCQPCLFMTSGTNLVAMQRWWTVTTTNLRFWLSETMDEFISQQVGTPSRIFFNVRLGSWVSMVYVGRGKFGIYLKDRFGGRISTPRFNPPMKFELERQMLPFHEFDVLPSPFAHDNFNFEFSYEKRLTADDYESLSNFSVSSFLYLSVLQ